METELETRSYRQTAWILVVGGIIGIIASIELIIQKISVLSNPDFVPNCDINPVLSCGSVINTEQASLFGFPNPVLGVIGFTIVIMFGALLFAGVELPRSMWLGLNLGALAGMSFVVWLVGQSLCVIGALCPWCMVTWIATIALTVVVKGYTVKNGVWGTRPWILAVGARTLSWAPTIIIGILLIEALIAQVRLDWINNL
jgi:uncharacterized membrane protein